MAHSSLRAVQSSFIAALRRSHSLSSSAHAWAAGPAPGGARPIPAHHEDVITESAFLRAFAAWESFLEEAFILYSLGKTSPKGKQPKRCTLPPNRASAKKWLIPEGRRFSKWSAPSEVITRSARFFLTGDPFSATLRSNQTTLEEIARIRNAIAHSTTSAADNFQGLVRDKLGSLPQDITVGKFLATMIPGSHPPESFFECYLREMESAAKNIIRL